LKESYFMKAYKKKWYLRVISMGICTLVFIGILGMGIFTYYKSTNNPIIIKTNADYDKAAKNNSYVKISADQLYNLDFLMTEETSPLGIKLGNNISAHVAAIKLGEKMLIISLPPKVFEQMTKNPKAPYILKGKVSAFRAKDLSVLKGTLTKDGIVAEDIASFLCSKYIDYGTPIEFASIYFVIAGLFAIVILVIGIPVMVRSARASKRFKKYSLGNLEVSCEQISNEIVLPQIYKKGPVTITESYIIVERMLTVFAMPLSELMWVYKSSVQSKSGDLTVVKKSNSIEFVFSDKSKSKIKVNFFKDNEKIEEIIEYISQHCKKSYVGYSKELADLFKKNKDEFVNEWRTH